MNKIKIEGNFKLIRIFPITYMAIFENRESQVVFHDVPDLFPGNKIILVPHNFSTGKDLEGLPIIRKEVDSIIQEKDLALRPSWFINLKDIQ